MQVYSLLDQEASEVDKPKTPKEQQEVAIIDFTAASAAVLESAGNVSVKIKRHGKTSGEARCRYIMKVVLLLFTQPFSNVTVFTDYCITTSSIAI